MTLTLREGIKRLTDALNTDKSGVFIIRIVTSSKPTTIDPDSYAFFYRLLSVRTASIGLCSRKACGQAALQKFKETFYPLKVWTCFLPIPKQFILIERQGYDGSILTGTSHKAYVFTGNLFSPTPSDTITSVNAQETKELRELYAKLT